MKKKKGIIAAGLIATLLTPSVVALAAPPENYVIVINRTDGNETFLYGEVDAPALTGGNNLGNMTLDGRPNALTLPIRPALVATIDSHDRVFFDGWSAGTSPGWAERPAPGLTTIIAPAFIAAGAGALVEDNTTSPTHNMDLALLYKSVNGGPNLSSGTAITPEDFESGAEVVLTFSLRNVGRRLPGSVWIEFEGGDPVAIDTTVDFNGNEIAPDVFNLSTTEITFTHTITLDPADVDTGTGNIVFYAWPYRDGTTDRAGDANTSTTNARGRAVVNIQAVPPVFYNTLRYAVADDNVNMELLGGEELPTPFQRLVITTTPTANTPSPALPASGFFVVHKNVNNQATVSVFPITANATIVIPTGATITAIGAFPDLPAILGGTGDSTELYYHYTLAGDN